MDQERPRGDVRGNQTKAPPITTVAAGVDPYRLLDGRSVLITGATGSFGRCFVRNLLARSTVSRVAVYSRDEFKQYEMQ
jgi:UDP-N-acetylglucosamine 4,6-dehydratase